ncbi:putative reverse transcriptase domain-containing protein [Tanacetum coccineum]
MAKTMEQYMSKTRTDYGSRVARPKIEEKDSFELKGQFLKELQENTFSGSDNEDANEHIEKVLKIVDLFHVPNIIVDQLMLRFFPISLTGAASRWLRNEPTGLIKTWEDLKTKFLNKYCPPGRTAKKMEEINNFQQEPDETLYQAWERFKELLMKCHQHYLTEMQETSDGLAAIQAQLNNLGREIKKVNEKVYAAQVGCGGYRATAPGYYQRNNANPSYQERRQSMEDTLSKFVLQERGFGSLPSSTETNSRDQVKSISTTIEADSHSIRRIGSSQYAISTGQNSTLLYKSRQVTVPFPSHFIVLDMPEDIKVPLILRRPFLSTSRAKIDVYKRKITLRVGEENIIFKSIKPASSLIKRVYMLILRERMELDLKARLMGETLVLNRSLDHFLEDYIELNDLNEPFELRRNQGDDLMPTIEEGKVIEEFRTRDEDLDTGIDDYPSYCDYDKKIHIDFLEDMDAYRDEGMSDVSFGEPFLKEVGIKTKWFEGIITLYNSDDEVTYQMVRSHLKFKRYTNEQCNKIPPLLKVSEKDKKNGISHAYQKLKGFYKGVLNLGSDYIRNAKTKEWLTRGHISVHEME